MTLNETNMIENPLKSKGKPRTPIIELSHEKRWLLSIAHALSYN
jgi:hypothetical protein